jgi:hypothetical protein
VHRLLGMYLDRYQRLVERVHTVATS